MEVLPAPAPAPWGLVGEYTANLHPAAVAHSAYGEAYFAVQAERELFVMASVPSASEEVLD